MSLKIQPGSSSFTYGPCHFIFWTSWKQSIAHQLLHPLLGAGDSHYARWSLYGGGSISASPVCLQCVEQTMEKRGNKLRNLPRVDALRRGAGFTLQPRSAARRTNTVSVHAENLRKSPSCFYFPCSLTKGLSCSLSWAYQGSAGCVWSYRLGWRCEATVSRCRCTCSLSGESRLGVVLDCASSQTLEKRAGKWDLPVCLVTGVGRRMGCCNAQRPFLSSPGSLYKPVESLWSSTSVSLRRISWSIMRGWNQTSGIWWKSFRTSSTNRHVLRVGSPRRWFSALEN